MFAIGEYVVYGSNGICVVKDIAPIDIPGMASDKMYYYLCPVGLKESKIYSPVDNPKVVMRKVITREEAQELMEEFSDIPRLPEVGDRQLELQYKEVLASCDVKKLVSLIKTIMVKRDRRISMGKKITSTDERYLKKAGDSLYSELAYALDKDRNEVEQYVMSL
jgi:CarD family transcriptional regulator